MSILRCALLCASLLPVALPARAHHTEEHHDAMAETVAGSLIIAHGFTRATRPGAPVAGGFMTITNTAAVDDRLSAAASAVAGVVQIHEVALSEGIMRMRELDSGLPIPAGETVTLEPGGYHVMFMDLKGPLVEGDVVEVTLTFDKAGVVTVPLAVLAPNAEGLGHGGN